jgi:hypothetical protein
MNNVTNIRLQIGNTILNSSAIMVWQGSVINFISGEKSDTDLKTHDAPGTSKHTVKL